MSLTQMHTLYVIVREGWITGLLEMPCSLEYISSHLAVEVIVDGMNFVR